MGLSFFNQRRAMEAEKAKLEEVVEVTPEVETETEVKEETEEVVEVTPEVAKVKKTDAEKLKKKK